MREPKKNYLRILRIELEDLESDVAELIAQYQKADTSKALTDHVVMANLALFKNEMLGLKAFEDILRQTDPDAFPTLDAMIEHLRTQFRERIRAAGIAEAVALFVDRKLVKVSRYLQQP